VATASAAAMVVMVRYAFMFVFMCVCFSMNSRRPLTHAPKIAGMGCWPYSEDGQLETLKTSSHLASRSCWDFSKSLPEVLVTASKRQHENCASRAEALTGDFQSHRGSQPDAL
jgi:hypothetical protein